MARSQEVKASQSTHYQQYHEALVYALNEARSEKVAKRSAAHDLDEHTYSPPVCGARTEDLRLFGQPNGLAHPRRVVHRGLRQVPRCGPSEAVDGPYQSKQEDGATKYYNG